MVTASVPPALSDTLTTPSLELDLQQAIQRAWVANTGIALSVAQLNSSTLNVHFAKSRFRPTLAPVLELAREVDGTTTRTVGLSATRRLPIGGALSMDVVDETLSDRTLDDRLVRLQWTQPLFRNFGTLTTREPVTSAVSAQSIAKMQLTLAKTDLTLAVVDTFEAMNRQEHLYRADERAVDRLNRFLATLVAMDSLGRTAQADRLQVELQLGRAELRLSKNRDQRVLLESRLRELLNIDTKTSLVLKSSLLPDIPVDDVQEARTRALSYRTEHTLAQQMIEDAEREYKIARRGRMPDIELIARLDQSIKSHADGDQVFVALRSRSGFTRHEENNREAQAQNALHQRQLSLQLLSDVILREVEQAFLNFQRSVGEIELAGQNLEFAKLRLSAAQKLFDAGRGSSFSVSDAEEDYVQTQTALIIGQSERVVSAYQLLKSMGELVPGQRAIK